MKWTTEVPAEPGWYWWQNEYQAIQVVHVAKRQLGDLSWVLTGFSGHFIGPPEQFGGLWAGPIPKPIYP